jgi:hypothetical protein
MFTTLSVKNFLVHPLFFVCLFNFSFLLEKITNGEIQHHSKNQWWNNLLTSYFTFDIMLSQSFYKCLINCNYCKTIFTFDIMLSQSFYIVNVIIYKCIIFINCNYCKIIFTWKNIGRHIAQYKNTEHNSTSITARSVVTFSVTRLTIMILSIVTINIITLSILTLSISTAAILT